MSKKKEVFTINKKEKDIHPSMTSRKHAELNVLKCEHSLSNKSKLVKKTINTQKFTTFPKHKIIAECLLYLHWQNMYLIRKKGQEKKLWRCPERVVDFRFV